MLVPTQEQFNAAYAAYTKKKCVVNDREPYEFIFSCEHVVRAGRQLCGIEITMEQAVDILDASPFCRPYTWKQAKEAILSFIRTNNESV